MNNVELVKSYLILQVDNNLKELIINYYNDKEILGDIGSRGKDWESKPES